MEDRRRGDPRTCLPWRPIVVISAEKVPGFDFVPSWFIGAGVFFGLMNPDTFAEAATRATVGA